jgi:hypothetical protein
MKPFDSTSFPTKVNSSNSGKVKVDSMIISREIASLLWEF